MKRVGQRRSKHLTTWFRIKGKRRVKSGYGKVRSKKKANWIYPRDAWPPHTYSIW
jgi:hypothetical protein